MLEEPFLDSKELPPPVDAARLIDVAFDKFFVGSLSTAQEYLEHSVNLLEGYFPPGGSGKGPAGKDILGKGSSSLDSSQAYPLGPGLAYALAAGRYLLAYIKYDRADMACGVGRPVPNLGDDNEELEGKGEGKEAAAREEVIDKGREGWQEELACLAGLLSRLQAEHIRHASAMPEKDSKLRVVDRLTAESFCRYAERLEALRDAGRCMKELKPLWARVMPAFERCPSPPLQTAKVVSAQPPECSSAHSGLVHDSGAWKPVAP